MPRRKRTKDAEVNSWIEEELQSLSENLKTAIQGEVGVDTGALQESITIEKRGLDYYVGVDNDLLTSNPKNERGRDYASYHHDGTSRTPANPFLDKAMNKV